ncbi:hypothetical protein N6G96_07130 [Pediococcus inopinatus]|uniref:Uncharacterized protein n=1 Tax=Pediococcus inopinatus TaxID=114090 RepID=A0ABZ0Q4L2_9LACO|nr:hypothetical protein [Pediococcus inopinatus]WPC19272.1 hypothetical protein N6G95_08555 [Pediococcus inopinatus]WPC21062.1 hypothetical protein N6G96_07130 [Pediococcus inopinatus]
MRRDNEKYKTQRNWLIVLVLFLSVGLIGWIMYSGQQLNQVTHRTREQIAYANAQVKKEQKNESQIKQQADLRVATAENNNSNPETDSNKQLNQLSNDVFKTFYTFTPRTYVNRGNKLKGKLSELLLKKMFPSNIKKYAGTITAKLTDLQVFPHIVQGSTDKTAVVLVKYQSKYNTQDEMKSHQHLFRIHFDSKKNQIDEITDLGDLQQGSQGF